jgi:hypothetical protein
MPDHLPYRRTFVGLPSFRRYDRWSVAVSVLLAKLEQIKMPVLKT